MGDAGIDAILQFHFVFDEIGCISGYADVFEAIENEILLCFEHLGERFKFGGEHEEQIKKALMKFARSDRKKIGISRISINQIETGKTVPSLKTASDIANALGVCVCKVFDLDGEETYKCHCNNSCLSC